MLFVMLSDRVGVVNFWNIKLSRSGVTSHGEGEGDAKDPSDSKGIRFKTALVWLFGDHLHIFSVVFSYMNNVTGRLGIMVALF